ncbi:MAG: type II secretion system F family protein [Candidatus Woesearchaeota archaeon]|nr:type II secretion system F family protein [Candidatus Woesearchaeota archaeon]
MVLRFEARHRIGIAIGIAFALLDFLILKQSPLFVPFLAVAAIIMGVQFFLDFFIENQRQKEIEEKFPEFVRNFVGAVSSGMSPSMAVISASKEDYGALTSNVQKLAHQIEWSVPFHKAIRRFADSTRSPIIRKAIATVIEAESYGGNIEDVLRSVTSSLMEVKKIRAERRASIHSQIMQSYVIFIVFIAIIIVIQNFLIPYMQSVSSRSISMFGSIGPSMTIPNKAVISFSSFQTFVISFSQWLRSLNGIFVMLALIQGLFAGLVIGKLAEGDIRYGVKHSLILMMLAFIFITLSQGFLR